MVLYVVHVWEKKHALKTALLNEGKYSRPEIPTTANPLQILSGKWKLITGNEIQNFDRPHCSTKSVFNYV